MATIIHIGYHRTGTTFLQKDIFPQCQQHRFHGHREMVQYKLLDVAWRADRSIDYNALQEVYAEEDHYISFESFIGPLGEGATLIDVIPARLKKVFGDRPVKILMTIRKQDEFLKSLYAQWVASGGTNKVQMFLDQTVLEKPRIDLNTFDYLATYNSYAAVFGAENILVLPHELLKADQPKFLALLNEFSDENFQAIEKKKVAINRSLSGYQITWMRMINKFCQTQVSVDYIIPKRWFDTTRHRLKLQHSNFLRFGKTFTEKEEDYLKELLKNYQDTNAALDQLYQQYDLKQYGYYE